MWGSPPSLSVGIPTKLLTRSYLSMLDWGLSGDFTSRGSSMVIVSFFPCRDFLSFFFSLPFLSPLLSSFLSPLLSLSLLQYLPLLLRVPFLLRSIWPILPESLSSPHSRVWERILPTVRHLLVVLPTPICRHVGRSCHCLTGKHFLILPSIQFPSSLSLFPLFFFILCPFSSFLFLLVSSSLSILPSQYSS